MKPAAERELLIIAFLRDLRKKDIKVYAFVVAFLGIQLVLTLLTLKITPFYVYGMFSEIPPDPNTFHKKTIRINNKPLSDYHAPFREKLMLDVTSDYYLEIRHNNDIDILNTRLEKNYPWFTHNAIYPFLAKNIFNSDQNLEEYRDWFREKSAEILGEKPLSIQIVDTSFRLDPLTLQLSPTANELLATF